MKIEPPKKSVQPKTLKGFRDFLPKEARKRQYVVRQLAEVFESYGFEPLETPALEYAEILEGKYGEEGERLMYKFEDKGGRAVAMRYDQTVPLARVVAQYANELPLPFKRYQIQNVWRGENPQAGRFREFLQCDIDTIGTQNTSADFEILSCINTALKTLGFEDYSILVNSREVFEKYGANKQMISILDKEDKIGKTAVLELLTEALNSSDEAEQFYTRLREIKPDEIPSRLNQILKKGKDLNLFFYPFLARGLDYYTDLIFEVKIPKYKGGSVCGGGRYDNLIGIFGDKAVPAVGGSFGFDRLIEAMDELNLFPSELITTKVLVITLFPQLVQQASEITFLLRSNGINAEMYLDENSDTFKQFKYAEKKQIPYIVIPVDNQTVELRTKLPTGEIDKKTVQLEDLPNAIT